uniref:Reverse transcriptase domain-containing protein n=1 Tax=Kryptolebias marmoratus TaxID=37003 RepID=A0A3Q3ENM7_KRYMA
MSAADSEVRTPQTGSSVRFLSWNIKGMGSPLKRSRIFAHLKRLKPDLVFLQETHMRTRDQIRLKCPWVSEVFHSNFNSKARGVAILVGKSIQFSASKIISDKNGRYLIVTGTLFHVPILLVNIYAPNFDDPKFMNKLFECLPSLNNTLLVVGGDMNCVIDPNLDRYDPRNLSPSLMSRSLSDFMSKNGCIDPWRFYNPQSKKFSFFSHFHQSFSRIDYFFVDSKLISEVLSVDYHPIIISDHAPLSLDIKFALQHRYTTPWRFNPLLLSDKNFNTFISTKIDDFIEMNQNESNPISYSLLWESLKAFLRGQIISFSAHLNKTRKAKLLELSTNMSNLDQQIATSPSPSLLKRRVDLQTEIDLITTNEAERLLLRSRSTYYEHGDRASRLLAHQLRRRTASHMIPQIMDSSGTLHQDPTTINSVFQSFYSLLFKSESPADSSEMNQFLDGLKFPVITPDVAEELDAPLTREEIVAAMKSMQSNKAPGPDGFPVEFYKKFQDKLSPLLHALYNESLHQGSLPQTLTQACICLLLKKDKDPNLCSSYRPLSLINVDAKILAKALACRLDSIVPSIVSDEQTGFVKGRQLFYNIRTLLNIIYSKTSSETPELVISVDAEKAFDRIEWDYLFAVLRRFGLGNIFISWLRLFYTSPQATVSSNGIQSSFFRLFRGTRQGCPLSPLLFALAIEPLSIFLRSSSTFAGISRLGTEFKLSLYADDLLLYVSDPTLSIPPILSAFLRFGSFSGYKVNIAKSECYPVNASALKLSYSDIPFKLSSSGFSYLGVNVTRSLTSLFAANFLPLMSKIKSDLQRWNNLPLSLIGRINAVKMIILPKFLFLFNCLPLFLPKNFFKTLDQIISGFLWCGKPPRIRKSILHRCKFNGGLSLPDFQLYYWATHIHKISFWFSSIDLPWCRLEAQSCSPSSLKALLTSPITLNPSGFTSNLLVRSVLKIWNQFRRHFKFNSASTLAPLLKNHLFQPALTDPTFLSWENKGLTCFKDLYKEGIFRSFTDLSSEFHLPASHLFRYFQIRHCTRVLFPGFPSKPPNFQWEMFLSWDPLQRSFISKVYTEILLSDSSPIVKVKRAWELELGLHFHEDWWEIALKKIHTSSICARLSLIQFKVLFRVHLSKTRLSQILSSALDICDKCHAPSCNLSHMFYSCSSLHNFWQIYFETMSKILSVVIEPSPHVAIFGLPANYKRFTANQLDVISFTSLLARRRLLFNWKSTTAPSSGQWLHDTMS